MQILKHVLSLFPVLIILFFANLLSLPAREFEWQQIDSPNAAEIRLLTVANSGTAIAVSEGGNLYESVDDGRSWRLLIAPAPEIEQILISDDGSLLAADLRRLYLTRDKGITWIKAFDNFIQQMAFGGSPKPYLLFSERFSSRGLKRLDLESLNVTPHNEGLDPSQVLNFGAMAFTTDGQRFMVTDDRLLWRRDNETEEWEQLVTAGDNIGRILINNEDRIILATSTGMVEYLSQPKGLKPLPDADDNVLIASHSANGNDGSFLALTPEGDIQSLAPHGDRWTERFSRLEVPIRGLQQTPEGTILLASSCGLLALPSGSMELEERSQGMQEVQHSRLAFDSDGVMYLLTAHALYRSVNGGQIWRNTWVPDAEFSEGSLLLSVDGNNVVYVQSGSDLLYSTDKGDSWRQLDVLSHFAIQVDLISEDLYIATLFGEQFRFRNFELIERSNVHINLRRILYLDNGDMWALTDDGLFISQDNGANWNLNSESEQELNSGIKLSDTQWLIAGDEGLWSVDERGNNWQKLRSEATVKLSLYEGGILALGRGRLHFSEDGVDWDRVIAPEPGVFCRWMAVNQGMLYLVMTDKILLESSVTETSVHKPVAPASGPLNVRIASLPFGTTLSLSCELSSPTAATLALYSMTGALVALREFSLGTPGRNTLNLDTSNLPAGAYLVQLEAGGEGFAGLAVKAR